MDNIKNSQYAELASDLEINKAVMYLRQKNFKVREELRNRDSFIESMVLLMKSYSF